MLILKIMAANRGNDEHPRHPHQLICGVLDVRFHEPDDDNGPEVEYLLAGSEEPEHQALTGNVYVMNEAGKTISRFEVAPPAAPAPAGKPLLRTGMPFAVRKMLNGETVGGSMCVASDLAKEIERLAYNQPIWDHIVIDADGVSA